MLPRIPFASCLDSWAGTGEIDGYFSAAVSRRTSGLHRTRLASFPPYLLVQMKRWACPWRPGHAVLEHFPSLQRRYACYHPSSYSSSSAATDVPAKSARA